MSSIIAISLFTASSIFLLLPSNCAPVNRLTGIQSAEKNGEFYSGHDSGDQLWRNRIAVLHRTHCSNCLIDLEKFSKPNSSPRPSNRSADESEKTKDQDRLSQKIKSMMGRVKRQAAGKIKLPQALELVEQYGLTDCVARTSCELSCNPNIYGRMGRSLYRFMAAVYKRNRIPGIPAAAIAFYRTSIAAGAKLKGQNCRSECRSQYSGCTRQTPALLRMASHIDLTI